MPLPIIFFAGQALSFLVRKAVVTLGKKVIQRSAKEAAKKATGMSLSGLLKKALKSTGKGIVKAAGKAALKTSMDEETSKSKQSIDEESSRLNKMDDEDNDAERINEAIQEEKIISSDAVREESPDATPQNYNPGDTRGLSNLELLQRIVAETSVLKTKVKSIENFYYQREQDIEAEATEESIESKKDAEKVTEPKKGKVNKTEVDNKRKSAITTIATSFLGVLLAFGPILVRKFKENQEFIKNIPNLLKEKFLNIGKVLAEATDEYLIKPIKELFLVVIPSLWNQLMETAKTFISDLIAVPIRLFNSINEYSKELQIKALSSLYSVADSLPLGLGTGVKKVIAPYIDSKKKELKELKRKSKPPPAPPPRPQAAATSVPQSRAPASTIPSTPPTTSSVSSAIGSAEAGGSYDIAFGDVMGRGGKMRNLKGVKTAEEFANKKLSEMTFEEILRFQNERDNKNKGTSAVGKYQFMKRTLFGANMKGGLVEQAGLTMSDKFSPENQEKLQQVFLGQNAAILKRSGVPTTPGYLYMAHYIGPYGAIAVFKASEKGEDITVSQALVNKGYADPSKHNPELAKIRVSQLEEILSGRMSKHGATENIVEAVPEKKQDVPQIAASVNPEQPEGLASAPAAPLSASGKSINSVFDVQSGVDVSGLHPSFVRAAVAMGQDFLEKTGQKLLITSGYRDNAKQKSLWDAKVAELGGNEQAARKWVAEPMAPLGKGRGSFHMKGLALDINTKGARGINVLAGSRSKSTGWLESFGLTRPVPGEDWHVQPSATPPTPDNPLAPGAPIQVADKDANAINLATGEKKSKPAATQVASTSATGESIGKNSMEAKIEPSMRIASKSPAVVPVVVPGSKSSAASAQTKVNTEAVLGEYRLMLGTA